jgi:2-keto-3-deoxy-L-rhamnonate aldolase RhmA
VVWRRASFGSAAPGPCDGKPGRVTGRFELLLFTARPDLVRAAAGTGVDAVVVDLENRGKPARQAGADTEINACTPADVAACVAADGPAVSCRINAVGPWTVDEVEAVIDAGASEVLVPMATTPSEVESVQRLARDRARVGALIETPAAVAAAAAFAALGLSRLYIGLNDLAIARRTPTIFTALVDGTVESVAEKVVPSGTSLGLAGLTRPDLGHPVPCRLLIGEMARLGCRHAFMRRSFLHDVPLPRFAEGVRLIRTAIEDATRRSAHVVAEERAELVRAVEDWSRARIGTVRTGETADD